MTFWDMFVGGLTFFWSPIFVFLVCLLAIVATVIQTIHISLYVSGQWWKRLPTSDKVEAILSWVLCGPVVYTLFVVALFAMAHSTDSGLHWK